MKSVLLLGLGSSGQRFVRILRNAFGEEIEIYVWRRGNKNLVIANDLQSAAAKDPCKVYGLNQIASLKQLQNKNLDLVIVASISSSHFDDLRLVSTLNFRNILVEKPLLFGENLESSSEEALNMLKSHGCASGYFSRNHPLALHLKTIIRRESLGRPIMFRSSFGENIREMHPYEDFSNSYASRRKMGGGPLNTFSHDLDLMLFLFDSISNFKFDFFKTNWSEIEVQDIEFLNALGSVGQNSFHISSSFDFVTWPKVRCGEMIFEFGKVAWDWQKLSIDVLSVNTGLESFDFSELSFPDLIQETLKTLLQDEPLPENFDDAWRDLIRTGVILSSVEHNS